MIRPALFAIPRDGPGRLATMARPHGGDVLGLEMQALTSAGITVLVSLLSNREVRELELADESMYARGAGLEFYRLPIPDLQVPDRAAILQLARVLLDHLQAGAGVAIHCRAGIGRSSCLAAAILVLEGMDPEQARRVISVARGLTVPDTPDQVRFISSLRG
jgi:protein-tyrosine phosphatase